MRPSSHLPACRAAAEPGLPGSSLTDTSASAWPCQGRWQRLAATALAALVLGACSHLTASAPAASDDDISQRLARALPTQVLLLGEQHDAAEHQVLQRRIVEHLARRGQLAALVLEMAPSGGIAAKLPTSASEAEVRTALRWDERAWPWGAYGPAVMAAVQAGVPVLGGNLPMDQLRTSMGQAELEQRLAPEVLRQQQELIREGHCNLLPASQIAPMTRVQIARDLSMARTLESALQQARPGQVVVLISGSVHADKRLGVPQHLPPGVQSVSLRLQAGGEQRPGENFDLAWPTAPAPQTDHCAGLAEQFRQRGKP